MTAFNKLNLPETWKNSFSEYPNGYSLMEALIEWYSRVNDLIEWANVSPDKVKEVLQGWIDDGTFDTIVNDSLMTGKLDKSTYESFLQSYEAYKTAIDNERQALKEQIDQEIKGLVTISVDKKINDNGGDSYLGLQGAIDEALALNKARVLISGVYEIDRTLIIDRTNTNNNTQIVFFGGGQIKKATNFTGDRLLHITKGFHDEDNIVFENISFNGVDKSINGLDTFALSVPYNQDGAVYADGLLSKFVSFKNCTFHNFYRALRISTLSYNFYSCLFQNNIWGGFMNMAANNNSFFACQFRRNTIGMHIKQLDYTYGTVNNAFFNCIFESNKNAGLIVQRADYVSLFGGYFENNCSNIDTNYPYPDDLTEIQFIEGGNANQFNMYGVFFWRTNTDYCLAGSSFTGVINGCGDVKMKFDTIKGVINTWVESITATSTTYESDFTSFGEHYRITNGEKYKVDEHLMAELKKEIKSHFKVSNIPVGNTSLINFSNLIFNTLTNGKIKIKMFLRGRSLSGNFVSEGYIERDFYLSENTGPTTDFVMAPIKQSEKSLAISNSGAGAYLTENCLSSTSEITATKINSTSFKLAVTNLVNATVPNWGYATTIESAIIVEIDAKTKSYTFDSVATLE